MKKSSATNFIIFAIVIFALSLIDLKLLHLSELKYYLQVFETARYSGFSSYIVNAKAFTGGNEFFFWIITYLPARIFNSRVVYNLIIILCWATIFWAIVKSEKKNIFKLNFLILLIPNISFLYTYDDQLRNFVAITLIINGLFLNNYSAIFFSPFFHFSSLIILPPYLYQVIKTRRVRIALIPILIALLVFAYFNMGVFVNFAIEKVYIMLYSEQFFKYEITFGFLGVLLLIGLFIWFLTIDKKELKSENVFSYWILLCVWFFAVLFNRPTIMDRLYIYLFIYTLICLEKVLSMKNSMLFTIPISIVLSVQSYMNWFNYNGMASFKSFLDFIWYVVVFILLLILFNFAGKIRIVSNHIKKEGRHSSAQHNNDDP